MHPPWTSEQIEGLAYDKYGVRASRTLSTPEKWLTLGQADGVLWGVFPNRHKAPLQTTVTLSGPRFSCTCANYKFPCNHSLGLISLYLDRPDVFAETDIPTWVKSDPQPSSTTITTSIDTAPIEPSDYEQRRHATLMAGLRELELWLQDMVRQGFATLVNQPRQYWTQMADRLVDAQASEVAREIRLLATIPGKSDDWPEQLLARIGRLNLLIQGFHNLDALPVETQADLQAAVGWPYKASHVTANQPVRDRNIKDRWQIIGRRFERIGKQKVQRVWLWGETSNRPALIVDISHGKQIPDTLYIIGMALDATLYFYPGSTPLRAEITKIYDLVQPSEQISGFTTIEASLTTYAEALATNPWLPHFPLALQHITAENLSQGAQTSTDNPVTALHQGKRLGQLTQIKKKSEQPWFLQDSQGYTLLLPEKFDHGWHLKAIASEGSLRIFGEWNGHRFHPLSIWKDNRWLPMNILRGIR